MMMGLVVASACGSSTSTDAGIGSGGSVGPGSGGVSGGTAGSASGGASSQTGQALAMLSLAEAPAATRTFFWGTIDVTAPGFVGPPRDEMTIGLGPDNGLRYLSWKTLPMLPKTFGDATSDFPLSGSRSVDLSPDITYDYTATVANPVAPTADHFVLAEHVVSVEGQCDYVEATEGNQTGTGWSVTYSDQGKLYGAAIAASAQADGQTSLWSAPVELSAPGFFGPPVDHLTVSVDGNGQLRWFAFQNFVRQVSFTGNTQEMEPGAVSIADEGVVTFDDVVPATAAHFVIRYHAQSDSKLNDYTEGLDGTRQGDALVVRYFISGKLWGAAIDGHAAGTLVPASPSATGGSEGTGGANGGSGASAGGSSAGGSIGGGAAGQIMLP